MLLKSLSRTSAVLSTIVFTSAGLYAGAAPAKASFHVSGSYFEGCSCGGPCPCTLTGPNMSCEGVGFYMIKSGTFMGKDLSGVKTAYAVGVGKWTKVYIDAPASKQAAAAGFMKAMLAAFGPMESSRAAKVTMTGSKGKYMGTVDGGKVMKITTVAVLGGDGKTPLTYSNINDPVTPIVMQGKTVAGSYSDGKHTFTLAGSNAYFNDHVHSSGKL
ncbi:MAG TPA: DUF1326 domain-containing protein [Fimbriimonadaceae bacterium]|nr:DUF1326 domain-containing protein [Fimbriimonadaceae bacterium]